MAAAAAACVATDSPAGAGSFGLSTNKEPCVVTWGFFFFLISLQSNIESITFSRWHSRVVHVQHGALLSCAAFFGFFRCSNAARHVVADFCCCAPMLVQFAHSETLNVRYERQTFSFFSSCVNISIPAPLSFSRALLTFFLFYTANKQVARLVHATLNTAFAV